MGLHWNLALESNISMKSFVAIALAFLVSAISADYTCDDCMTFSGNMQTYLMSEASVAEQTELLVAILCPQSEDAALCETAIRGWWGQICAAMYPKFLDAGFICGTLGACKKTLVAAPTCEECTGSIAAVADLIGSEAQIAEIIDFLKGDGLCGSSADADCAAVMDALMPYAMPTLAGVLVERDEEFCCTQSPSGVCCKCRLPV